MKILRNGSGDADFVNVAVVAVGRNHNAPGSGALGHARDQEVIGTHYNRSFGLAELHAGLAHLCWAQTRAQDSYLRAGQCRRWHYRFNVRLAVDVFLAQQTFRDSHKVPNQRNGAR